MEQLIPDNQPISSTKSGRSNIWIFWVILLSILLIFFITPIPYYQTEELICKPEQTNCSKPGWHTNSSILQSILASRSAQSEPIMVVKSSPTLAPDPIAGWKTYLDPYNQYSFRYPQTYSLDTTARPYLNRNITWSFENNSFSSCKGDCPFIDSSVKTTLGGRQAMKITGYLGSVGGNVPQSYVAYEVTSGSKYFIFQIEALPFMMSREEYARYGETDIQPIKLEDLRIFDQILSTFKFIDASASSATGTVGGKVCYPSEGIPAGVIRAKNVDTGEIASLDHPIDTPTFSIDLKEGVYKLRFEPGGNATFPGYHTGCSGVEQACQDSTKQRLSVPVTVNSGKTTSGVKLCDFYYSDSLQPDF